MEDDRKVRVARQAAAIAAPVSYAAPPATAPVAPAAAPAPAETGASAPAAAVNAVKSPMVGTAYLAPNPESKNFVAIGQSVAAGDTLLIVEAMKVMNSITAPSAGTVRRSWSKTASPSNSTSRSSSSNNAEDQ